MSAGKEEEQKLTAEHAEGAERRPRRKQSEIHPASFSAFVSAPSACSAVNFCSSVRRQGGVGGGDGAGVVVVVQRGEVLADAAVGQLQEVPAGAEQRLGVRRLAVAALRQVVQPA